MTKSGVGTTTTINQQQQSNMNGQVNTSIAQATSPEIPIWVSDRKKWVTGISKKTTINDIIYAILKHCHINCEYEYINDYVLVEIMFSLTNDQSSLNEPHQQQNFTINSERVLKGNSKVYKYLSKWIENANKLILKVKKCELVQINDDIIHNGLNASLSSESSAATENHINNTTLDTTLTGVSNTNTITKFFKKLANVNNNSNASSNSNVSSLNKANLNNSTVSNKQIIKYVDVKLPTQQQQPTTSTQPQTNQNMIANGFSQSTLTRVNKAGIVPIASLNQQPNKIPNEYELDYDQPIVQQQKGNDVQLPYKQYDPTLQKTLIISNILDKDKKLNQQFERVKLLDELIKEAEKTLVINENYYLSNQQFIEEHNKQTKGASAAQKLSSTSASNLKLLQSDLNLNDIYSCFPEMYTHGSNEVEEFQLMCTKLLSLDDNVHQQKQLLNKLETDIQKELMSNNTNINSNNNNDNLDDLLQVSSSLVETPETAKLKKEVTLSREQTRVQCKELHDLDLRMRQNESILVNKENELKNLLEELYLHEVYLDSVSGNNNETNINNSTNSASLSYIQKPAIQTTTHAATNSKLKTLASTGNNNNNNNALSSSSTSTSSTSSASLTPPINENLINKSSVSAICTIISQQQQQKQQQISPLTPPPLPASLPPSHINIPNGSNNNNNNNNGNTNGKSNDHCDNDSGISSMSSENEANLMHHSKQLPQYIQIQKSVMETLV